jgi:hypothetical protein
MCVAFVDLALQLGDILASARPRTSLIVAHSDQVRRLEMESRQHDLETSGMNC